MHFVQGRTKDSSKYYQTHFSLKLRIAEFSKKCHHSWAPSLIISLTIPANTHYRRNVLDKVHNTLYCTWKFHEEVATFVSVGDKSSGTHWPKFENPQFRRQFRTRDLSTIYQTGKTCDFRRLWIFNRDGRKVCIKRKFLGTRFCIEPVVWYWRINSSICWVITFSFRSFSLIMQLIFQNSLNLNINIKLINSMRWWQFIFDRDIWPSETQTTDCLRGWVPVKNPTPIHHCQNMKKLRH